MARTKRPKSPQPTNPDPVPDPNPFAFPPFPPFYHAPKEPQPDSDHDSIFSSASSEERSWHNFLEHTGNFIFPTDQAPSPPRVRPRGGENVSLGEVLREILPASGTRNSNVRHSQDRAFPQNHNQTHRPSRSLPQPSSSSHPNPHPQAQQYHQKAPEDDARYQALIEKAEAQKAALLTEVKADELKIRQLNSVNMEGELVALHGWYEMRIEEIDESLEKALRELGM